MRIQILVSAGLIFGAASQSAFADHQSSPILAGSGEKSMEIVEEVRSLISTEFYREEVREAFEDENAIPLPSNGDDVSGLLEETLRGLNASHTGRYTPDRIDYYEMIDTYGPTGISERFDEMFPGAGYVHYSGIGSITRKIDDRHFVIHVYPGTPADEAGLLVGDELLSVDGEEYEEIASFRGKAGQESTLRIRRDLDAEPFELPVTVQEIKPNELLVDSVRRSARMIEANGIRIGYLRLWTFARPEILPIMREILSTGDLAEADVLVLDMRSRWGGAPADAGEFFLGRTQDMSIIDGNGKETFINYRWTKPVIGVIDAGTRSGMEVLAYSLQQAGVPLVGETTAGAVLAGKPWILSDYSVLLLAIEDVRVNGERLEGHGVRPNIEVERSVPYSSGQDPQMEKAIEEARRVAGRG